jgi:hypothetical protein
LYFRKPKSNLDEDDIEDAIECADSKISKKEPETTSEASTSCVPKLEPSNQSLVKIEKEERDCWYHLEDAKNQAIDLLPSGVIKNSSKLRFDVKEISLNEDV